MRFHCDNGQVNAPQCYVKRTLPSFLHLAFRVAGISIGLCEEPGSRFCVPLLWQILSCLPDSVQRATAVADCGVCSWPWQWCALGQWFPIFFHLLTPWQPISINCALHIGKMFVINIVAVISILYVVTVNCNCWRMCLFPPLLIFLRNPKCPGSYPWGYAYPRLGITALGKAYRPVLVTSNGCIPVKNPLG